MPASRRRPPAPIDPRGRDHTTATAAELTQTAERGWDRLDRARKILIERIAPNPDNPRTHYDELAPLAESIAVRGLLLPLLVRADPERPGYYLVIAGCRLSRRSGSVAELVIAPRPYLGDTRPRRASHIAASPCFRLMPWARGRRPSEHARSDV